jgi:hypothetical protein
MESEIKKRNLIYMVYDKRAEIMNVDDCFCMYIDEDIDEAREYAERENGVVFEAEYIIRADDSRKIIKQTKI